MTTFEIKISKIYTFFTEPKFTCIFSFVSSIAFYIKLIAGFSSESTNQRTWIRGYVVLIHILISCQNLLSKTQFWIRFPSSILANLHELHCLEVNIVISCILWSFKHPRVKYAVSNRVAAGLIKSLPFIKCLSMKIIMVLK